MTSSRILIADDSPTNVFVLTAMLRLFDFACRVASDGAEAVALAQAEAPALILMDINMPKLNGIEAAKRIRADRADRVAVTAHPDSRHLAAFREAGFDALMVKPIDLATLREIVTRSLAPSGRPAPALRCSPRVTKFRHHGRGAIRVMGVRAGRGYLTWIAPRCSRGASRPRGPRRSC